MINLVKNSQNLYNLGLKSQKIQNKQTSIFQATKPKTLEDFLIQENGTKHEVRSLEDLANFF